MTGNYRVFQGDYYKQKYARDFDTFQSCKDENNLFKQENEELKSMQCPADHFQIDSLKPTGNIGITLIRQANNVRETDVCLGTATNVGYFTSTACCQADEKIFYNIENGTEIFVDENSIWTEKNICFINTTERFEFNLTDSDEDKTQCSIMTFDSDQGTFHKHQLQLNIRDCTDDPCEWTYDPQSIQNQLILNGTTITCDQSANFGTVIKSKYCAFFTNRL